jgi:prepilin-type N-terminal cleavage/methylation domain-containing protein
MTDHSERKNSDEVIYLVARSEFHRRLACCRRRGYSLVEMMVAMTILGVLFSMGIPRFQNSLEQSLADVAGANLRSIWSGQRLYWLENRTYSPDIQTLVSCNLIDPSLVAPKATYTYEVTGSSDQWFTATATRVGSPVWSGSLTIAADGTCLGSIQKMGQSTTITPGFP